MTHIEFWINIITLILLFPAIFYAAILSRQIRQLQKNQELMFELAKKLQLLAQKYEKEKNPTAATVISQIQTPNDSLIYDNIPNEKNIEKNFSMSTSNGQTSTAEQELLEALRSIK